MKGIYTIAFCIASFLRTYSQAPSIEWQKSLGGNGHEEAFSIIQTSDGGYAVAGYSDSTSGDVTGNHGGKDYWIVKLNGTGIIEWQKSLGGSDDDEAHSIIETIDGGYVVAGTSKSNDGDVTGNHGGYPYGDYWIVKLNSNGTLQWQKTLGGSGSDNAFSIIQTTNGGYAVAGSTTSNNGDVTGNHGINKLDYWIVKLDSTAAIQWQKSLGGSEGDGAFSIIQTSDDGYVVAGYAVSNNGDVTGNHGGGQAADYWVVKLYSNGTVQWQQSMGGTNDDVASSIIQTADSGYAIVGYSNSNDGDVTNNHGNSDYWIVKLYTAGTIEWQKSLGGSGNDNASSIIQTTDGSYMVAGYSVSNNGDVTGNHSGYDYWVAKLHSSGTIQWQKSLGGSDIEIANSLTQTNDGGLAIAGSSASNNGDVTSHHGSNISRDYWIVKLGHATGLESTDDSFDFSIYPNPATNQLFIETNNVAATEINIYNTTGILVNQIKQPQNKSIDISQLANGVYIADIKTKDASVKRRWVKM